MIQPLRTVHRRVAAALALALPAILLLGLGARRPASPKLARMAAVPPALRLLRASVLQWESRTIAADLYADRNRPGDFYAVLTPFTPIDEPDLLVYWSQTIGQGNVLPAEALLLGEFVPGKPLLLPPEIQPSSNLILYSLAHQTVVGHARLEKLP
jgi:hypothetical protein